MFFAFVLAIALTRIMEELPVSLAGGIMAVALVMNVFVAQNATTREMLYHNDTQNLMVWIREQPDFQKAADEGHVFCNAAEPSAAIPSHIHRQWAIAMPVFKNAPVPDMVPTGGYFIYSSRFGKLQAPAFALMRCGFYSKYWQVYQKR